MEFHCHPEQSVWIQMDLLISLTFNLYGDHLEQKLARERLGGRNW